MPIFLRFILYPIFFLLGLAIAGIALIAIAIATAWPNLPGIEVLTDYRPKMPLQVYSRDGFLIGEFGEERRAPIRIQEVPDVLKQAILAAEDDSFYKHYGVDPSGIARAALANIRAQGASQGASTITQQVARNFFLRPEKNWSRKFYEALLSFKIEMSLSKDQIFEIYINQIFLGQRAYGFASAAQIYFGKPLADISIAEAAMLAGLPKAPSAFNPVVNPSRARKRQEYVLRRLRDLGYIDNAQYQKALDEPLVVRRDSAVPYALHAEYVAEMARQIAAERFSEDVYSGGIQVFTSITREDQELAYRSLRQGVLDYDRRHGYRGAEAYIDLSAAYRENENASDAEETLDIALQDFPVADDLLPAIALEVTPSHVSAYVHGGLRVILSGDAVKFASRMMNERAPADRKLRPGAIIRVQRRDEHWQIAQLPEVEAAFIAADPKDGRIRALVGGFDFNRNMYNHVTQAWRQPGSSFKPFIYSAALDKGFSPGSIVMDSPFEIPASSTGSRTWSPKNYDGTYGGPMTLRTALAKSRNIPSVRLLQAIGTGYTQAYITRFGFDAPRHPPYLTMALGAGSVTPWQMAGAYAIFANGGYRIMPYVVDEIRNHRGRVLARSTPPKAGDEAIRAIDPRNAYLMYSMLLGVANSGTAARASATLKRHDLGGKTGTTNDYLDAWFCGFQPTVVGCAWIGFDQPHRLGNSETGGHAALPIWINFMKKALANVPEQLLSQPEGVASAYGDLYYSDNIPAGPTPPLGAEESDEEGEEGESGEETPTATAPPIDPTNIMRSRPANPPSQDAQSSAPKPPAAPPANPTPPPFDPARILGGH
ncbi:MAG: penicillin-binding protein 1A [Zoogloeaceae bacterium]|jgi:penicillin-binding protein 1A|nr:penicillin-binding protein 1A [Zoogloeaceae bacterium]